MFNCIVIHNSWAFQGRPVISSHGWGPIKNELLSITADIINNDLLLHGAELLSGGRAQGAGEAVHGGAIPVGGRAQAINEIVQAVVLEAIPAVGGGAGSAAAVEQAVGGRAQVAGEEMVGAAVGARDGRGGQDFRGVAHGRVGRGRGGGGRIY